MEKTFIISPASFYFINLFNQETQVDAWLIIGLILLVLFAFSLRFDIFRKSYRKLFESLNLITRDTTFGDQVDEFDAREKSAKI